MKRLICLSAVVFSFFARAEEKTPLYMASPEEFKARKAEVDALSPEEREALREKRIAWSHEKGGGMLRDTRKMSGKIFVVNAQSAVSHDDLVAPVKWLADFLKVDIEVVDKPVVTRKDAINWRQANSANAVIVVSEENSDDTLLVAPEKRWACVNVRALAGDKLVKRTQKEVSRALAFVCGGMSSQYAPTLGSPLESLDDLDSVESTHMPIDILMAMQRTLPGMGVRPYRNVMYRKACKEGWAPAPTNDVQKAIWESVKAEKERGPVNALQIKP